MLYLNLGCSYAIHSSSSSSWLSQQRNPSVNMHAARMGINGTQGHIASTHDMSYCPLPAKNKKTWSMAGSSNAVISLSHLDTGPLTRFFCRFITVSPAYQRISTHVCLIQNKRWTCRYNSTIQCYLDFPYGAYITTPDNYDHYLSTHRLSTHVSDSVTWRAG